MLVSCGNNSGNVADTTEEAVSNDGMKIYTLYMANADWTDVTAEGLNIDQMETTENVIDKLMNTMITANAENDDNIPVPEGLSYQRYIYDGQGHIMLMFNVDYETADPYKLAMCKLAFTKTLCQVEGIECVEFELTNLINEEDVVLEEYNEDSFIEANDMNF
jgi:hypothetical protein